MKNTILIFVLIISSSWIFAQDESRSLPISVGYFSNFVFQPGIKIGTQVELKNWKTEHEGKKGNFKKLKSYLISPQIGFYSWPNKNINFLVNTEFGYQRLKSKRNTFFIISIGFGYLLESNVTSVVYNLSDGSIKKKNREQLHYFLPTLNYEFGKAFNPNLSWYSKFSMGSKLSTQRESSMVLFVETGVKFNIRK